MGAPSFRRFCERVGSILSALRGRHICQINLPDKSAKRKQSQRRDAALPRLTACLCVLRVLCGECFSDYARSPRCSFLGVILSVGGATEGSDAESKDPEDLSLGHAAAGNSSHLGLAFHFWQFRRSWQFSSRSALLTTKFVPCHEEYFFVNLRIPVLRSALRVLRSSSVFSVLRF